MYLNSRSEATWCKYFPTTLKGVAQSWITKGVKEGSIAGWKDLSNKFKSKFSTANRREKITAELMSLQQAEDESLRDYLTRFSNESSRITSLDQDGKVLLPVTIGKGRAVRSIMAEFLIVDAPSVYNVMNNIQRVVSTYHQTMIYVSDEGHSEKIKGSQKEARRCNHLKPSKGRRDDQDDKEEKERDRCAKKPKGFSVSAQGTPAKEKSLGDERASSSSEPKDSENQLASGKPADIDSRLESEESNAKAMELDN
ncbi:uncharacterized protein LOC110718069 [Chenopodium quinoa]|uniref:uncharacterized protein LOC110718069 n=1 Tax=Chenopodium quinoa TaxID=63459 RepID=UPI000B7980DE|nr:uncharacterized protein LOC110718069 [Chenopodium quinoa]